MGKTKIDWADYVWNPVTGCNPVSEGCQSCYARRMAYRLRGRCGYQQDNPFKVTLHSERLEEPLRWKKPKRIFVCSMGDLFHEEVPYEFIAKVWEVMCNARQHTFIVLTKRPHRMEDFLSHLGWYVHDREINPMEAVLDEGGKYICPNIWLGVTVENQERAEERSLMKNCPETAIDWVIAGGETGPNTRPIHPDWVRNLRNQCQQAGVPFFFKSWGEWTEHTERYGGGLFIRPNGQLGCQGEYWEGKAAAIRKVGKKTAGRLLDGRTWDEFPDLT